MEKKIKNLLLYIYRIFMKYPIELTRVAPQKLFAVGQKNR